MVVVLISSEPARSAAGYEEVGEAEAGRGCGGRGQGGPRRVH